MCTRTVGVMEMKLFSLDLCRAIYPQIQADCNVLITLMQTQMIRFQKDTLRYLPNIIRRAESERVFNVLLVGVLVSRQGRIINMGSREICRETERKS